MGEDEVEGSAAAVVHGPERHVHEAVCRDEAGERLVLEERLAADVRDDPGE